MASKSSGKIVKILFWVVVFIGVLIQLSEVSLGALGAALLVASMTYIFATLFGFILSATGNYLIAGIIFLALFIFVALKMGSIPKMNPVLEWLSVIVVCGIAVFLLFRDIRYLKNQKD